MSRSTSSCGHPFSIIMPFAEELANVGVLRVLTVQTIELGAKLPGARQGCEVPADMLAGDTYAHDIAVEGVQLGQVLKQNTFHLEQAGCWQVLASTQVMLDFPDRKSVV